MPGYLLIEERWLQPYRDKGFPPNPVRMGFLDYMRELRQEVFPFTHGPKPRIVGLDDVLLAAGTGENLLKVSVFIRSILAGKANELEANNLGWVQVVFRRPLRRADDFWFEPGGNQRVSLRPIFDSPMKETDSAGNEFYRGGFNLT
jgi:hypothetical protein